MCRYRLAGVPRLRQPRHAAELPRRLRHGSRKDHDGRRLGYRGALGIPALWGGIDDHFYGFLDTGLHPNVLNAYQALAIDEERKQFPPTLWTTADAPGQVVEQVWFSGVHCDVGGGYPTDDADNGTRLADIGLAWMLERAQLLGLQVDPGFAASYPATLKARYALNTFHNSRQGVFSIAEREPRAIPATSILASSVAVRCRA